jgi:hypothetical protein
MREMDLKTASKPKAAQTRAALAQGHYYVPIVFDMSSILGATTIAVHLDPRDTTVWRASLTEDLVHSRTAEPQRERTAKRAGIRTTLEADKWPRGLQQVWTDDQLAEALEQHAHVNGIFGSVYVTPSKHNIMRRGDQAAGTLSPSQGTLDPLYVVRALRGCGCKQINGEEGDPPRVWAYDMARRILKGQLPIASGIQGGLTGARCLTTAADARLAHKRIRKYATVIERNEDTIKNPLDAYGQLLRYMGALETCLATVALIENDPAFHATEIAPCQAAFVALLSDGLVDTHGNHT